MIYKKLVLALVWGAAVLTWAGLVGYYFTGPTARGWTIGVTAAVLVTEVAFWTTAAILGLSLWESRKKVFSLLKRPFRRS